VASEVAHRHAERSTPDGRRPSVPKPSILLLRYNAFWQATLRVATHMALAALLDLVVADGGGLQSCSQSSQPGVPVQCLVVRHEYEGWAGT
jgi:hypothetical protein